MAKSKLVPLISIVAVAGLAFAFNPSPERHRDKIKDAITERSPIAQVLPLGSVAAFASNYHSLGLASYTKVGDRVLSVGFMGYVHVLN